MIKSMLALVHDSLFTTNTQKTFNQDFITILNALEFLENLDYIFHHYYMPCDVCKKLKTAIRVVILERLTSNLLYYVSTILSRTVIKILGMY